MFKRKQFISRLGGIFLILNLGIGVGLAQTEKPSDGAYLIRPMRNVMVSNNVI